MILKLLSTIIIIRSTTPRRHANTACHHHHFSPKTCQLCSGTKVNTACEGTDAPSYTQRQLFFTDHVRGSRQSGDRTNNRHEQSPLQTQTKAFLQDENDRPLNAHSGCILPYLTCAADATVQVSRRGCSLILVTMQCFVAARSFS